MKTKRKDGRPKAIDAFEKYNNVLQQIPDDGKPTRFKDIADKLPGMSRATISAALTYFVSSGMVEKKVKNRKLVEYIKIHTTSYEKITKDICTEFAALPGVDTIQDLSHQVSFLSRTKYKEKLLEYKNEDSPDNFNTVNSVVLNQYLQIIDKSLVRHLYDYANETDAQKRELDFNNHIQFFLIPYIKEMLELLKDVGMDREVYTALSLKERQALTQKDFDGLEFYKKMKEDIKHP